MRRGSAVLLTVWLVSVSAVSPTLAQEPTTAPDASTETSAATAFGDGTHIVGVDIPPGTYRSTDGECHWARLADFSGEPDAIIAAADPSGPTVITVAPTDAGFQSEGCGTWTLVSSTATSNPSTEPSPEPVLHGDALVAQESAMPGSLGLTLDQFVSRWNGVAGEFGREYRISGRPRVTTSEGGTPVFTTSLSQELIYGSDTSVILTGRVLDGTLSNLAFVWAPIDGDEIDVAMDRVNAHIQQVAFQQAVNPRLTEEESNALSDALWPEDPEESLVGREVKETVAGVTYTMVGVEKEGDVQVTLTARADSDNSAGLRVESNTAEAPGPAVTEPTVEDAIEYISQAGWRRHQVAFLEKAEKVYMKLMSQGEYGSFRRVALQMIARLDGEGEWVSANRYRFDPDSCAAKELRAWERRRRDGETSARKVVSEGMKTRSYRLTQMWLDSYFYAVRRMDDLRKYGVGCVERPT